MSAITDLLPMPTRTRLRPSVVNAALGVLVAGGIAGGYLLVGPAKAPTAAVRTATAAKGVVLSSVSASGTVQAPSSIAVNFKTSGQIVAVDVKAGQHVREGQALGKGDPTSAQLSLSAARPS